MPSGSPVSPLPYGRCTTVAAGLAALRERVPALLLLDMNLPDGSGMDVLAVVRAESRLAAMPVVVVSADAMSAQVDAALAAGADSYLPKPLRMAEVLSHIDDALRLGRLRAGDVSDLDGMTNDEAPSLGPHEARTRDPH